MPAKQGTKRHSEAATTITRTWWDWHLETYEGLAPGAEWNAAVSAVHRALDSHADGEVVLEALKRMGVGATPTAERILKGVHRLLHGEGKPTLKLPFLLSSFDAMVHRHRPQWTDGWPRNDRNGLVAVIEAMSRVGKSDTEIWARLCMWVSDHPTEPMILNHVLRCVTDFQDTVVRKLSWPEIERRAFAWKSVTL